MWREPAFTGGAAISAYDLRHIRSNATDKDVDESWTDSLNPQSVIADDLRRYHIPNLENGVSYDVQARATNSAGTVPGRRPSPGRPTGRTRTRNSRRASQARAACPRTRPSTAPSVTR